MSGGSPDGFNVKVSFLFLNSKYSVTWCFETVWISCSLMLYSIDPEYADNGGFSNSVLFLHFLDDILL